MLLRLLKQIKNDDRGQDLIEYALLAGFVAVGSMAVFPVGVLEPMEVIYTSISNHLSRAASLI